MRRQDLFNVADIATSDASHSITKGTRDRV